MSKSGKRKISLILGLVAIVSSVLLTAGVFLQDKLPLKPVLGFLSPSALTAGRYAVLSVAALILIEGILFLVCRKKILLSYIFIPYTVAFYYTLLALSHRFFNIEGPAFLMTRLSSTRIGLLGVLCILEIILFLLLLLIVSSINESVMRKRRFKAEVARHNAEKAAAEASAYAPEVPEEKEETPLSAKELKKAAKERQKELKKEQKASSSEAAPVLPTAAKQRAIAEEAEVVTVRSSAPADPNRKIEFPSFAPMPTLESFDEEKKRYRQSENRPPESLVSAAAFQTVKREVTIPEHEPVPEPAFAPKEEKTEEEDAEKELPRRRTFRKGGLLEASLESVAANPAKQSNQPASPRRPIIGFEDTGRKEEVKAEATKPAGDSFAPSTLPKNHPRYKLFEALKDDPRGGLSAVSHQPSKPFAPSREIAPEPAPAVQKAPEPVAPKPVYKVPEPVVQQPVYKAPEPVKTAPVAAPVAPKAEPAFTEAVPSAREMPISRPEPSSPQTVEKRVEIENVTPPEGKGELETVNTVSGIGGLQSNNGGLAALAARAKVHYQAPPTSFLKEYPSQNAEVDEATIQLGQIILQTMADFHIEAESDQITVGPTVTMFEYRLAPGILVSKLNNIQNNLTVNLRGRSIRILTQIPGKQTVGIEVANTNRAVVGFKEMLPGILNSDYKVPMILGKTITGEPICLDVAKTPHLLIAGTTGSGKSVCVNSLLCSILYTKSPKEVRLMLVDPKIVELSIYNGIGHLLTPVINEAKKVVKALDWLVDEMTRRYKVMMPYNVRNIEAYNNKIKNGEFVAEKMPYIVLIMDEFADLMVTVGKEIEDKVGRLCAMSRAVGIHVVMATQRPSTDVITGTIKSNIPTRIAFAVSSGVNSRIILDSQGAEDLLGKGDMLYSNPSALGLSRIQGAFLSDEEVEKIVQFVRSQGEPDYLDPELFEDIIPDEEEDLMDEDGLFDTEEDLYEKAKSICYERKSASASYLQRRMKIGYNKAARFVERMEDEGIVGPAQGSKPREILDYTK
jgi:DNA segregation ATPase FtsK/SpoIIIE and related proteins